MNGVRNCENVVAHCLSELMIFQIFFICRNISFALGEDASSLSHLLSTETHSIRE